MEEVTIELLQQLSDKVTKKFKIFYPNNVELKFVA